MGLKTALTHTVLPKHLYLKRSLFFSALFFILFTAVTLTVIKANALREQHQIAQRTATFTSDYLRQLTDTMLRIGLLTAEPCPSIAGELNRDAAFSVGVRDFQLVRNGIVFCSSASGNQHVPANSALHDIDFDKNMSISLQMGTPAVPNRAVILIWQRNAGAADDGVIATLELTLSPYMLFAQPGSGYRGFALLVGDSALISSMAGLIPVSDLPRSHFTQVNVDHYPFSIRLYSPVLTRDNILFTISGGLLLSLLVCALIYHSLLNRHNVEREILRGLKNKEFFVEYQPVIDAKSLKVTGVEALLRWQHPIEGRIPPDIFISYAENQGLIVELTQHMMALVAADAHTLQHAFAAPGKLSINISPHHMNKISFHDDVMNFIEALPENAFQVIFEITERGMIDTQGALREFNWLRRHKIEIAIDDFGTGHSALIYLEKFTLDYLKIDRGFVMSIDQKTLIAPVLDTVLRLTEELKIKTVAEGVETPMQAEYLRNHGVTYLQGFLYSKSLGVAELVAFIRDFNEKEATWQI
ncbi:cyclic di-GMP phosphodiesterase [Rahnella sp. SL6]|uniref:cyclic di-GMP phosphodiesterase n=1 Tax=Rahnella perminowiae TaxID=2816244 RepID=UPI001C25B96E|nr:cyclic di-GMP phosphodiesterase [Rahnella perminowiae]MBU9812164.1 cyclic di-GMP phosphodiesterase [Rahnella perminowiae]MCX2944873.1 cyclic di-GMP phosphodiesterase [Rahnella perminowiae]